MTAKKFHVHLLAHNYLLVHEIALSPLLSTLTVYDGHNKFDMIS